MYLHGTEKEQHLWPKVLDDFQEIFDIVLGHQLCVSGKAGVLRVAPICLDEALVEREKAVVFSERIVEKGKPFDDVAIIW
jgi:hypothetical protein